LPRKRSDLPLCRDRKTPVVPKAFPTNVLPLPQELSELVLLVGELIRLNPHNGQDQVVPSELAFAFPEPVKFAAALLATEETGREDGDQEGDGIERFVDPPPPVLSPLQVFPVAEDRKILAELLADFPAQLVHKTRHLLS